MAKHRTRASDANRTAVQQALDEAFAAGRLDHFEHFERIRAATKAKYVDELRPLVADLRGVEDDLGLGRDEGTKSTDPSLAGMEGYQQRRRQAKRRRNTGVAVAGAVLALTGLMVAAAVTSGPSNSGSTTEKLGPGLLHTEPGVTRLLAETRDEPEFGSQDIDSIFIYGEYATLAQQDPTDADERITYEFRGGWKERRIDPIEADADLDIDSIEASDVMAAISAAPAALELDPDETVTSHVQVSADALGDPEYRVSASEGEYGDLGTATFGPDGQLREVTLPD